MRHAVAVRIAYLISWRGGELTGPFKKMKAQARTWCDLGHQVGLFVATDPGSAPAWNHLDQAVHVEVIGSGWVRGVRGRRRTYRALERWDPDLIYLRHGVYSPGLRRLVRRFPTVVEVNGDEVAIARQTSRFKAAWTARTRSLVLSEVAGGVFMTDELATGPSFAPFTFARIIVPNGIDLAANPALPPTADPSPRLVLLGHPRSPWHGTDKLLGLAQRHPDWSFDVIGPTAADLGGTAPANLRLHPELPADDYLPLLARADIGIGSLAMHRVGASQNPALKVREYLARGLPVILGCRDPDFPDPVDFVLELPNTPSNVADHDEQIAEFVRAWQGVRVGHDRIAHLDLTAKERVRLAFLARFARPAGVSSGRATPRGR